MRESVSPLRRSPGRIWTRRAQEDGGERMGVGGLSRGPIGVFLFKREKLRQVWAANRNYGTHTNTHTQRERERERAYCETGPWNGLDLKHTGMKSLHKSALTEHKTHLFLFTCGKITQCHIFKCVYSFLTNDFKDVIRKWLNVTETQKEQLSLNIISTVKG